MTAGVYRFSPIWSPHGTYIAYVYGTGPHPHLDDRRLVGGPRDQLPEGQTITP